MFDLDAIARADTWPAFGVLGMLILYLWYIAMTTNIVFRPYYSAKSCNCEPLTEILL